VVSVPAWVLAVVALGVGALILEMARSMARTEIRAPKHAGAAGGPDPLAVEQALLRRLNEWRTREGADPLGSDPALEEMARQAAAQAVASQDRSGEPAPEEIPALRERLHPGLIGPLAAAASGAQQRTGPDPDQAAGQLVDALARGGGVVERAWTRAGVGVAVGRQGVVAVAVLCRRLALLDREPPRTAFLTEPLELSGEAREGAFTTLALKLRPPSGPERPVPLDREDGGRFRAAVDFREGPGRYMIEWSGGEGPVDRTPIEVVG